MNLQDGSRQSIQQAVAVGKEPLQDLHNGQDPEDDYSLYPKLNWRRLGNYEEIDKAKRYGPGEYGAAVSSLPSEKEAIDASIKEFGFNMVNSEKISLDRLPPDLRHEEYVCV